jgi:hypothetical protein
LQVREALFFQNGAKWQSANQNKEQRNHTCEAVGVCPSASLMESKEKAEGTRIMCKVDGTPSKVNSHAAHKIHANTHV